MRYVSMCSIVPVVLVVLVTCGLAHAQEEERQEGPSGADPTDFITRYEPSFEHRNLKDGSSLDLLVMRADFSFRSDLSFRLDLPLVGFKPGPLEEAGFRPTFSIGDTVTQVIHKPYSSDRLSVIYGLRIDFDTATAPEVAAGGNVYAPLGAVAVKARPGLVFIPLVQWFLASDLDNAPFEGTVDRNKVSYRQLVLWEVGHRHMAYLMIDPEFTVDIENDNEKTFQVGIEFGKPLAQGALLVIKPTIGFTDRGINWGFKFAFRHLFPGLFLL